MLSRVVAGAEPWRHVGVRPHGVLCIHGFGGSPYSLRGVAEAFARAGYHVEVPLLAGHGTSPEDLAAARWKDWTASAEEAYLRLASRVDSVVVVGLSMGGAVTVWLAAEHPELAGIVCVNPLVHAPRGMVDTLHDMLTKGELFLPHRPNDIADPDAVDVRSHQSPVPSLISLFEEGVEPLTARHPDIHVPLLLMTAPEDHSVPAEQSDALAAAYGGPLERVALERSFHIATLDYDKDLIEAAAVAFADKVVS
jgi:carboxylesterase